MNTKNEDSRGLMKLTTGRDFVPKFRGKLFEDEHLKRHKIDEFWAQETASCA